MNNQNIAIVGDYITDVVFPDESRNFLGEGKETLYSALSPNMIACAGPGGIAYSQLIFDLLLDTHLEAVYEGNVNSIERKGKIDATARALRDLVVKQYSDDSLMRWSNYINHWRFAKTPRHLTRTNEFTYRLIENFGRITNRIEVPFQMELPKHSSLQQRPPGLLLIADYCREIRTHPEWQNPIFNSWLDCGFIKEHVPRRIILLGNRLPKYVSGHAGKEIMWDAIFSSKEALSTTVIVTSVDRLRHEGANISKRLSWDSTLKDFQREIETFEPLKRLARVAHLVVRIGVVGAIHCYSPSYGNREIRFFYDPKAAQGVYRDRARQGNVFAIRSIMPACIAFHLFLANNPVIDPGFENLRLAWYDRGPIGAIRRGIKDAISLAQQTHTAGFGANLEDVTDYVQNLSVRRTKLLKTFLLAQQSLKEQSLIAGEMNMVKNGRSPNTSAFTHIVRPPSYKSLIAPLDSSHRWTIFRDNLRAMIKHDQLLKTVRTEREKGVFVNDVARAETTLIQLEEFRRLRAARAIAILGIGGAMNNRGADQDSVRKEDESIASYLFKVFKFERRIDRIFRRRTSGEIWQQDIRDLLVPEWRSQHAFPLNAPVASFGDLHVLGRTDIENFSRIRDLISTHIAKKSAKPLSIAVFGSPGSGKSFGITSIAKAIGGDSIEFYTCNLTQLNSREDLNREFFNAFQILLRGKIPVIFFDEFDCPMPGMKKFTWLKYFLEPMQDGIFRHPHGSVPLNNSIFVFAGGISETFDSFRDIRSNAIEPGEALDLKLRDFESRINGVIDIPGLDRNLKKPLTGIPYVRRAVILRSLIERETKLLNSEGVAQIDRNVIDAFLRVKNYRHGARSLSAIFGMCMRWGSRIDKFSVPTKEQLDIHTNGQEFYDLMMLSMDFSPLHPPISNPVFSQTLMNLSIDHSVVDDSEV